MYTVALGRTASRELLFCLEMGNIFFLLENKFPIVADFYIFCMSKNLLPDLETKKLFSFVYVSIFCVNDTNRRLTNIIFSSPV